MKTNLTFLLFYLFISIAVGQTPSSIMSSGGKFKPAAAGPSAFNPWLGAQLIQNFEGTGDFVDNLVITGRVLYEPKTNTSRKLKFPIMGNISDIKSEILGDSIKLNSAVNEIIFGDEGLNVGVYPYYILNEYADDDFYCVVHASAGWKLNGFQLDSNTTNYLNIGRVSAGMEIGYGMLDKITGDKPITLSITPVLSFFDKTEYNKIFDKELGNITSLEVTVILPISNTGIGVMLEKVFSANVESLFRAGIIFTGKGI